jgi:hypothetical protein
MAEFGCLNDINVNNLESNNLLIKKNTQDVLYNDSSGNIFINKTLTVGYNNTDTSGSNIDISGSIRWNPTTNDLEGNTDGTTNWKSLTSGGGGGGTIGAPTDDNNNNYEESTIAGFQETDTIANAFVKVDDILARLAPAKPPTLNQYSSDIKIFYTNFTGLSNSNNAHQEKTNNLFNGIYKITNNSNCSVNTNLIGDNTSSIDGSGFFKNYQNNTLTGIFLINDTNTDISGFIDLTSDNQKDSSGIQNEKLKLEIKYDSSGDYNLFWNAIKADISANLIDLSGYDNNNSVSITGGNKYNLKMKNNANEITSNGFRIDDAISPSIEESFIEQKPLINNNIVPHKYISGVKTYYDGSGFYVTARLKNCIGSYYNYGDGLFKITDNSDISGNSEKNMGGERGFKYDGNSGLVQHHIYPVEYSKYISRDGSGHTISLSTEFKNDQYEENVNIQIEAFSSRDELKDTSGNLDVSGYSNRQIRLDSKSNIPVTNHVTSGLGLYPSISTGNIITDPSGCGITYDTNVHKISLETSGNDGVTNDSSGFIFHELQFIDDKFQKPNNCDYENLNLPLESPNYTDVNNISKISSDISGIYGGFYRWTTFKIFTIPEIGLNQLKFNINGVDNNNTPDKLFIKVNNDNPDNGTKWLDAINPYDTNNYSSTNSLDDGSGCLISLSTNYEKKLCVLNDNSGNYDISGDVYVRLGLDVIDSNNYKFSDITIDDSPLIYDGYLDISGGTHKFLSGVPTYTTDDYVEFTARYMFNIDSLGTFTTSSGINSNGSLSQNNDSIITHRFNFSSNDDENANIVMNMGGDSFSPSQDLSGFHVKNENTEPFSNSTRKIRVDSTSVSDDSIHVTSGLGLYPSISIDDITTDPSGCGITYNNDVHKISLNTSGNDGYSDSVFNFHELQFKNGKFQIPDASGYDTLIFPTGAPNYSTPNEGVNDITNISADISGIYGGFYRWATFKHTYSGATPNNITITIVNPVGTFILYETGNYKLYVGCTDLETSSFKWFDANLGWNETPTDDGDGCVGSTDNHERVLLFSQNKNSTFYIRLGLNVNINNSLKFSHISFA